jgi:tetratricopeptide (TPR) repeat protein
MDYMKEAAKAYESMEALLVPGAKDPAKLLTVAKGLWKSGKALEAITFLRQHDIHDDTNLLHFLGDVLFSIGDYRSAGAVYRRWIELGCKGYYLDPDDPALWAIRIGASSCSSLPIALRSKLDYLEQRIPDEDESLKLPPADVPAVRSTAQ